MSRRRSYGGWYEELFPSEKVVAEFYPGKTAAEVYAEQELAKKVTPQVEAAAREEVVKQAAAAEKRVTEEARQEAGEKAYAGAFGGILVVGLAGLGLWLLLRKR